MRHEIRGRHKVIHFAPLALSSLDFFASLLDFGFLLGLSLASHPTCCMAGSVCFDSHSLSFFEAILPVYLVTAPIRPFQHPEAFPVSRRILSFISTTIRIRTDSFAFHLAANEITLVATSIGLCENTDAFPEASHVVSHIHSTTGP